MGTCHYIHESYSWNCIYLNMIKRILKCSFEAQRNMSSVCWPLTQNGERYSWTKLIQKTLTYIKKFPWRNWTTMINEHIQTQILKPGKYNAVMVWLSCCLDVMHRGWRECTTIWDLNCGVGAGMHIRVSVSVGWVWVVGLHVSNIYINLILG